MLDKVSNLNSVTYGVVAAGFFAAAGGLYLAQAGDAQAAGATVPPAESAIDLAAFTPGQADAPVTLMAQINRSYQFPINDGADGQSYFIPLFAAADDVDSTQVVAAVMVEDLVAFEAMLAENVIGNARMGDLYAIEGTITEIAGYSASVDAAFEMASLTHGDTMVVIAPTQALAAVGSPLPVMPIVWSMIAASLGLVAAGFVISRRDRKTTDAVADRFSRIHGIVVPAE